MLQKVSSNQFERSTSLFWWSNKIILFRSVSKFLDTLAKLFLCKNSSFIVSKILESNNKKFEKSFELMLQLMR